jgi:hypothetical protein
METKNSSKGTTEMSSKSKRVQDAIVAIFVMLPNNIRNIRRMVGFGFFIDQYGKVDTIPCAVGVTTQKPLDDNLVLCLVSVSQLSEKEVVEVVRTSEQYRRAIQEGREPEIIPLQLWFLPAKLQLADVKEGSKSTEYIYDLVPTSSEANIVAYAALIPDYAVVPVDTSQLEEVISTVIRS